MLILHTICGEIIVGEVRRKIWSSTFLIYGKNHQVRARVSCAFERFEQYFEAEVEHGDTWFKII